MSNSAEDYGSNPYALEPNAELEELLAGKGPAYDPRHSSTRGGYEDPGSLSYQAAARAVRLLGKVGFISTPEVCDKIDQK